MRLIKFLVILNIFFYLGSSRVNADSLKVMSYNLGLAHTFVPLSSERLPALIKNIKKTDSDVICMQEVWTKKDRSKIIRSLKRSFPYTHNIKIKQKYSSYRPTCKMKDLFGDGKFLTCVKSDCKGTSGDEYTGCIIKKCRGALETLKVENADCAQGVIAQVGKTTLQAMAAVFNPFKGAGLFSYKGSDGLLILSKYKMYNQRSLELADISTGTRRRVLFSDIDIAGKKVTIGCTHLTANLSRSVPYTGEFTSWEMENFEQVKQMINATKDIKHPLLLAGDFNCSQRDTARNVMSQFGNSCDAFSRNDFKDSFQKEVGHCTFCEKNTLVRKSSLGRRNFLLDHIFSKNIEATEAQLKFSEIIKVRKKRKMIDTNLSDHYAIKVEFQL